MIKYIRLVRCSVMVPLEANCANSSEPCFTAQLSQLVAIPTGCSTPATSQPCKGVKHLPALPMMMMTSVCLSQKGFNKKKTKTIWNPSAAEVIKDLGGWY